ncbi:MAG: hypothetical protein WCR30_02660 [Clostridia bacterium]
MKVVNKELGFEFSFPANWKIIKPTEYSKFSILNSDSLPCLMGFAIPNGKQYDVVSILNYGINGNEFLAELGMQMKTLEENKDELIEELDEEIGKKAQGYVVNQTKNIKHLCFKKISQENGEAICNVMNVKTNIGDRTSYQFFVETPNVLLGILTQSMPILKKDFPEVASEKYQHINQIIKELIPSIKPIKL